VDEDPCGDTAGTLDTNLYIDGNGLYYVGDNSCSGVNKATGNWAPSSGTVTSYLSCVDGECETIICPTPTPTPTPTITEYEIAESTFSAQDTCGLDPITLYSTSVTFATGIKLYTDSGLTEEVEVGTFLNYLGTVYQYISDGEGGGEVGGSVWECSATPTPTPTPTSEPTPTPTPTSSPLISNGDECNLGPECQSGICCDIEGFGTTVCAADGEDCFDEGGGGGELGGDPPGF
jgi:chitinase